MVEIKQKTVVDMNMSASAESHARTRVAVRDVEGVIDEPTARGGTNQGLTPTETLMASLVGCTNVITQRIAHGMGVEVGGLDVKLGAKFDRRGVSLQEEIEQPFADVVLDITIKTDATPDQMAQIQTDLAKYCPIAKVIRGSGVTITENWTVQPL